MTTTNFRYVVGIDYSMTCPAACCIDLEAPDDFSATSMIYVLDSKKKSPLVNIESVEIPKYASQEERFDYLSDSLLFWIQYHTGNNVSVWIEDYAFAARGKVFHIGENAGLLKHKLWRAGIELHVVPPTVVKKFAAGKGNADKDDMYKAFSGRTNTNLVKSFGSKMKSVGSPFGDLADAFFIARYGADQILCPKPSSSPTSTKTGTTSKKPKNARKKPTR